MLVPNPTYPIHPYGFVIAGADIRHVPMLPGLDFFEELENAIDACGEALPDETATLYEMGIPVVETGDKWHYDIGQKVPLTIKFDVPSFLVGQTSKDAPLKALDELMQTPGRLADSIEPGRRRLLDVRSGDGAIGVDLHPDRGCRCGRGSRLSGGPAAGRRVRPGTAPSSGGSSGSGPRGTRTRPCSSRGAPSTTSPAPARPA